MKQEKILSTNELKQCTFYVKGMHCASCEILIEKKLLKHADVAGVDASLNDSKVAIVYEHDKPDIADLNELMKDSGYEFTLSKPKQDRTPMLRLANGQLIVNQSKLSKFVGVLALVALLLASFFVFEKLQLGQYVSVDANTSLLGFASLGLVAGLSSCAALIGGLLLSMTKQWNELYIDSDSNFVKSQPHLMFHIGRLMAFFFFGGMLGLIGDRISLTNPIIYSALVVIISIVMLQLALQMMEVEWGQKFMFKLPKRLTNFAADETNFKGKLMPFSIGALTFLLPCGFTLIAQGVALTSGSFLRGALIMLAFAIGTFPILMGISLTGVKFNSKPHLTAKFNMIAGILLLFFVIYNINGQMNVLGLPSLSDIKIDFTAGNIQAQGADINSQGVQELHLIAKGFDYIPTSGTVLKAGVPAKLIVDNQGIAGCGSYLAARGLISNYISLKSGVNVIDLGKPAAGTYKITCSMGMVPPVTIQVI